MGGWWVAGGLVGLAGLVGWLVGLAGLVGWLAGWLSERLVSIIFYSFSYVFLCFPINSFLGVNRKS